MFTKEVLEIQFEFPFGDGAVNLVKAADEEARRFKHNYLGTEHLLLGHTSVEKPNLLSRYGIEIDKIRAAVEWIIGKGDRDVDGDINFTPGAKRTIYFGIDEAKRLDDKSLKPDHIMLGLTRAGEGMAVGVLESLGLTLDNIANFILPPSEQK